MTDAARGWVLAAVAAAVVLGFAIAPPFPQDPAYHRFADDREALGIPSFWNVASNVPFGAVGVWGLSLVLSRRHAAAFASGAQRAAWGIFFAGVLGTAAGSAWYHLDPTTERLFWDRLPMAVGFAGLTGALLGERMRPRLCAALTACVTALAVWSVVAWRASERAGEGDLRAYAAVQYAPLAVIPLALLWLPPRRPGRGLVFAALVGYGLAKAFEALDHEVLALGRVVSGHTLKHLAAAAAAAVLGAMLVRRARAADADPDRGVLSRP
jgi:hypothetical protein